MVTFNWETYTPFTLGFDETFSRLEALAGSRDNYPPYNVINGSDGRTVLELALAGFTRGDIEVETERNVLQSLLENLHLVKKGIMPTKEFHIEHSHATGKWQMM